MDGNNFLIVLAMTSLFFFDNFKLILTLYLQCRKIVRHTLKILQHLLKDF